MDFQNPAGDIVTFELNSCNAGQHALSISYSLASADPPRPLRVEVNGQVVEEGINFPATGAWTEWGKVHTTVQLLSGVNTISLTATTNSGPNLDSIEVYPAGDYATGVAHITADNQYQLYVNNRWGQDTTKLRLLPVAQLQSRTRHCPVLIPPCFRFRSFVLLGF